VNSAKVGGNCKILVPSGVLGAGCPEDALERGLSLKPDCIAVDGGSTDSGPYYLGTGTSKMTRRATKHDLRQLMLMRDKLKVPLLVGSCGTCGTDSGVDWMADIAKEIAREEGLNAKLALVYSEQEPNNLLPLLDGGKITPLEPTGPLTRDSLLGCDHVVALLGYEPLADAIDAGADIVFSGRTTDTAVLSAVPLMRGFPAGPSWHAAKTAECGGLCTVQTRQGGVMLTIDADGFEIEPLHAANQCTPYTVSAHLLYENSDPFRLKEPGVILDASDAIYTAIDSRSVRVTGSQAVVTPYTLKLEGSGSTGYRTMVFSAIADPKLLARFEEWLGNLESYLRIGIAGVLGVHADEYALEFRPYGYNALNPASRPSVPSEVGLMALVSADTQELATEIARYCNPVLLHFPLNLDDPLPSFAFPFSPAEVELGRQFEFKLNHVVHLERPDQLSRTVIEHIGDNEHG
jgi:Acyclic terpene utilisation family protein AtuA